MTDDHVCMPLVDDDGQVVARVHASPHLGVEGRRALLAVVEAASRVQAQRDAADPVGAAERAARFEAGQRRIRERNARLRGGA
ncbi:hypothetical protein GCM10010172_04580 [Paractinoplanes ferrugineus]|uniref:Uncharacterized protein n=1 Tax=Paractinoplanes ferrugineus TaxID=113564 RepID=A0A919JC01_9ACTN|nr:hypothetical protein [Actinoplanes ferrugineus]GIE16843.1 hypothetical protein Afe05nite_86830 [Actinoplanes ferrugineus]